MGLGDLPAGLLDRVVARLREMEPDAIAIVVTGSYARGEAAAGSDIDLVVVTPVEPRGSPYWTWFEALPDGAELQVSAEADSLASWLAGAAEPASWSLGLATAEAAVYVWALDAGRAVLGADPTLRQPASPPELGDVVETAIKVRRAFAAGDSLGGRLQARILGELTPRLLVPLNPERRVRHPREALDAALDMPVAPAGYREALLACLGLVPLSDAEVAAAADRLVRGLLAFLRERRPDVDPQPELARYLADGTLERQLG
jgi:hypothetical protein